MFSSFIAWYLFLGGAGSGAYVIAAFFSLTSRFSKREYIREYRGITRGGFYLGPALVGLGALFLIFDLGSPEMAYTLFTRPQFTLLTVGAWAILLFCGLSLLITFIKTHDDIYLPRVIMRSLEIASSLLALCVMVYTGVFISGMPSIPFLNTPLIIMLFIASSLSTGSALITLYGVLNQQRKSILFGLRMIPRVDTVFVVLELLALVMLFGSALLAGGIRQDSVLELLIGAGMPHFWLGVVICGIVIPLAAGLIVHRTTQVNALAINALALLAGGISLRYCVIIAGLHIASTL